MKSIKFLCHAMLATALLSMSFQASGAVNNAGLSSRHVRQYAGGQADNHSTHRSWFKKKTVPVVSEEPRNEPFGTFAMITAVVSVLTIYHLIAIFIAPIGILLSIISLARIKKHPEKWKGKKRAVWALVINILALAAVFGWFVYLVNNVFE